jgi:hypothetical protein
VRLNGKYRSRVTLSGSQGRYLPHNHLLLRAMRKYWKSTLQVLTSHSALVAKMGNSTGPHPGEVVCLTVVTGEWHWGGAPLKVQQCPRHCLTVYRRIGCFICSWIADKYIQLQEARMGNDWRQKGYFFVPEIYPYTYREVSICYRYMMMICLFSAYIDT